MQQKVKNNELIKRISNWVNQKSNLVVFSHHLAILGGSKAIADKIQWNVRNNRTAWEGKIKFSFATKQINKHLVNQLKWNLSTCLGSIIKNSNITWATLKKSIIKQLVEIINSTVKI